MAELGDDNILTSHHTFLLSDLVGEEDRIMYVWIVDLIDHNYLGNSQDRYLEVTPTNKHFHF
jgi:hypothetical protein